MNEQSFINESLAGKKKKVFQRLNEQRKEYFALVLIEYTHTYTYYPDAIFFILFLVVVVDKNSVDSH